jgi:hypothetical protein
MRDLPDDDVRALERAAEILERLLAEEPAERGEAR